LCCAFAGPLFGTINPFEEAGLALAPALVLPYAASARCEVDAEDVVVASEDVDPESKSKSDAADDRAAAPVPSMVVVYV
jgi:hypothetical protein